MFHCSSLSSEIKCVNSSFVVGILLPTVTIQKLRKRLGKNVDLSFLKKKKGNPPLNSEAFTSTSTHEIRLLFSSIKLPLLFSLFLGILQLKYNHRF